MYRKFKPVNISINDMDKFVKKELTKRNIYEKLFPLLVRLVN